MSLVNVSLVWHTNHISDHNEDQNLEHCHPLQQSEKKRDASLRQKIFFVLDKRMLLLCETDMKVWSHQPSDIKLGKKAQRTNFTRADMIVNLKRRGKIALFERHIIYLLLDGSTLLFHFTFTLFNWYKLQWITNNNFSPTENNFFAYLCRGRRFLFLRSGFLFLRNGII